MCEVAMTNDDWCVAVFKCTPESIRNTLVGFYSFMKDLEGVKSLHFLIRDRVKSEIVISFRVQVAERARDIIRSKMNYKLGTLAPDKFAIDPETKNPLNKYIAWSPDKRITKSGVDQFPEFCNLLSRMSNLVIEMLEKDYFDSSERVEIAHVMSWMVGCTEYGKMSPTYWEVGYYDRIEGKCCPYLRQNFTTTIKSET
jgi:hypothetical protein